MTSKRVALSLPARTIERLDSLKDLTCATSITDVVRDALMTYESIANHLANGVTFQAVKPDGTHIQVEFMIDVPQDMHDKDIVPTKKERELA